MKRIVKMLVISTLTSNIAIAQTLNNEITYKAKKKSAVEKVLSQFSFNYFTQYSGPSLSDSYSGGATYNRFDGGTSDDGKRYDTTGSTQLYQSFTLGYKLPKNMLISYGVTYQDNLNKDVEFQSAYGDTYTRDNGRSFNNHRIALWMPSIVTGSKASLSSSLFYEIPTTDGAKDTDMKYGVGIQPTLAIFSNIRGLQHGLTASFEKYVYPDNEFTTSTMPSWCSEPGYTCDGVLPNINTTKRQGTKVNLGGYLNYSISDKVILKSSVEFDYDQTGDDVGSLKTFGNNMDNIGNLGASYSVRRGVTVSGGVNFSLEEASAKKSALFGSLNLSI